MRLLKGIFGRREEGKKAIPGDLFKSNFSGVEIYTQAAAVRTGILSSDFPSISVQNRKHHGETFKVFKEVFPLVVTGE
jgi:hypothetical protein